MSTKQLATACVMAGFFTISAPALLAAETCSVNLTKLKNNAWIDDCACVLDLLSAQQSDYDKSANASGASFQRFHPLPQLVSAHGALQLDLTIATYPDAPTTGNPVVRRDYVHIGRYRVTGAPILEVAQISGRRSSYAQIDDPTRAGHSYRIPHACLQRPELAYGGARWRLTQGDKIRMTLRSRLDENWKPEFPRPKDAPPTPKSATNLHTHGAIVPPTVGEPGATPERPYGDYVFDVVANGSGNCPGPAHSPTPGAAHSHHQVLCGEMKYEIAIPPKRAEFDGPDPLSGKYHPSGLFWLHPHPHGYSRPQLNGGVSHLINIGELGDYVRISRKQEDNNGRVVYGPPSAPKFNIRHMQIKDAQVTMRAGTMATFDSGYDPGLCPPTSAMSVLRLGECVSETAGVNKVWVFTVNGQQHPRIVDSEAGETEIWRIANASPNVTYELQVVRLDKQDGQSLGEITQDLGFVRKGAPQLFTVLAVDGVGVGQNDPAIPVPRRPARRDHAKPTTKDDMIILMPGSRAEIMLDGLAPGRYVLRQNGFDTGQDQWPVVDLLEIDVPKQVPAFVAQVSEPKKPHVIEPPTADQLAALNPNCTIGGANVERKIVFAKYSEPNPADVNKPFETFGLIAGVFPLDKKEAVFGPGSLSASEIWASLHGKVGFGMSDAIQEAQHVCTYLERKEVWVLENWTNEIHNFHMHQSRFKRYTPANPDELAKYEQAPEAPTTRAATRVARISAKVSADKLYRQLEIGAPKTGSSPNAFRSATEPGRAWARAHHDSIPIPRAAGACDGAPKADESACQPGRISIEVRFIHPSQIGKFVYHCHILEHEDLGMMASIEVCDPKNPSTSCRAQKTPPVRSGALAPQTPTGGAHRH